MTCMLFIPLLLYSLSVPLLVSSFTSRAFVQPHIPPRDVCTMCADDDDAILIVDPVTEWREVLGAAKEKGMKSIAMICNPLTSREDIARFIPTPSVLEKAGFDYVVAGQVERQDGHVYTGLDVYAAAQRVKQLERGENITVRGVVPLSETGVEYSDLLSAMLGISSHNSLDKVLARRDKALMKEAVGREGLRVAKFSRISNPNDFSKVVRSEGIDYPIVIKTPQGFSSTDVFICRDETVAKSALTTILDSSGNGPDCRPVTFALVEEYIGGEELAVNVIASTGEVTCTDIWLYHKTISGGGSGSPIYNRADMMDPTDSRLAFVVEYAIQVARAVGIMYGAGHIELKAEYCSDSNRYVNPCLIEVGARLSGGRKASLSREVISEWDPFWALIDSHTGNVINLPKNFSIGDKVASHLFLPNTKSGVVTSIEGTEDIASLKTHFAHAILTKVGDRVEPTKDITTSAGFVWLVGSRKQIEKDSDTIKREFHVTVENSHSDHFGCLSPGLFIGGLSSIRNLDGILSSVPVPTEEPRTSVTVLSLLSSPKLIAFTKDCIERKREYLDIAIRHEIVTMADTREEPFSNKSLPLAMDVIDRSIARDGEICLVHCAKGESRSVAVVAAWLLLRRRLSLQDAMHQIRQAWPRANPNLAFITSLHAIEASDKDLQRAIDIDRVGKR